MDSPEYGSATQKQRLTLGFLISFMALCAKRASRFSKKLKQKSRESSPAPATPRFYMPKSPRPKELLTTISNKAITLIQRKKHGGNRKHAGEEEFDDGGVWQRSILMGDKCQPLDFSGVIYYDSKGNKLDDVPNRSPRASPCLVTSLKEGFDYVINDQGVFGCI